MKTRAAGIVTAFVLLAVVFSWPLPGDFFQGIPFGSGVPPERARFTLLQGDHLQLFYHVQLLTRAIEGEAPWLTNPYEFATPDVRSGPYLYYLPLSLVFFVFSWLGSAAAYNALFLTATVFSGLVGFATTRRLTGDDRAAFVAGVFLALVPYRLNAAANGHPSGYYLGFFVLALLGLVPAWRDRSTGWAAAVGLSLLVLALYEPQLTYVLAIAAPLVLLATIRESTDGGARASGEEPRSVGRSWSGVSLHVAGGLLLGTAVATGIGRQWQGVLTLSSAAALIVAVAVLLAGMNALVTGALATLSRQSFALLWRRDAPWQLVWVLPCVEILWPPLMPGRVLALVAVAVWVIGKLSLVSLPIVFRGLVSQIRGRPLVLSLLVVPVLIGGTYLLWSVRRDLAGTTVGTGRGWGEVRLFTPLPSALWTRTGGQPLYAGLAAWLLSLVAVMYLVRTTLGNLSPLGRGRREAAGEGEAAMTQGFPPPHTRLRRGLSPRGETLSGDSVTAVFAVLLAAGVVLSLGPALDGVLPVYRAAYSLVPFFGFIRMPAKFFALAIVCMTALVAYGTAVLLRRARGSAGALAAGALTLAVVADFAILLPLGICLLPDRNEAYETIARETAPDEPFLALPLWPGDSADTSVYQYWAMQIRRPMINGYTPAVPQAYLDNVVWPLFDLNQGELRAPQVRRLRELGVRHVTLHQDVFPPKVSAYPYQVALARLRAQPALEEVVRDGPVYLFRLRDREPEPPVPVESPLGIFYPARVLRRQTGMVVPADDALSGYVVRARDGERGFLSYGPYRSFPSGRFRTMFRVRGRLGDGAYVRIEVATEDGQEVLAERVLGAGDVEPDSFSEIWLEYEIPRSGGIEYRTEVDFSKARRSVFDVDAMLTQTVDEPERLGSATLDAMDLVQEIGSVTADADASNGLATQAGGPGKGILARGPWRLVGPGRYRACARVRAAGEGEIGRLEAYDGREKVLAGTAVQPTGNRYSDVCLDLALEHPEVLEFRLRFTGDGLLRFDHLRLENGGAL